MSALGAFPAALLRQLLFFPLPSPIRLARRSTAGSAALSALQLALWTLSIRWLAALLGLSFLLSTELSRLGVRLLALLGALCPGLTLPAGGSLTPVRPPSSVPPSLFSTLLWLRLGLVPRLLALLSRRSLLADLTSAPSRTSGGCLLSALLGVGALAVRSPSLLSLTLLSAGSLTLLSAGSLILSFAASLPLVLSVLVSVVSVVCHVSGFDRSVRVCSVLSIAALELHSTVRTPDGRG